MAKKLTSKQIETIKKSLKAGEKGLHIAKRLGLSAPTVYRYAEKKKPKTVAPIKETPLAEIVLNSQLSNDKKVEVLRALLS